MTQMGVCVFVCVCVVIFEGVVAVVVFTVSFLYLSFNHFGNHKKYSSLAC